MRSDAGHVGRKLARSVCALHVYAGAFGVLVGGCAPRAKVRASVPHAAAEPAVQIARDATLAQLQSALMAVPAPRGSSWAAVLFGAPPTEPGVTRVRIEGAGTEDLVVSLVPEARLDELLRHDARAHDGAMVTWSPAGLRVAHASDTSESDAIEIDAVARANETAHGTSRHGILLLIATGSEPASRVVEALHPIARVVHYVAWLVD